MTFLRNPRVLGIIFQVTVVLLVLALLTFLGTNLIRNFELRGLNFGFDFLSDPANFPIGSKIIDYDSSNSYLRAIVVGLLNSLIVMVVGVILATIVGIAIGIGRLSDNWLVRQLSAAYIEIFRNTPLLLQLFFWYSIFLRLPRIDRPIVLSDAIFLSNQGLVFPWPAASSVTWLSLALITLSIVLAVVLWRKRIEAMVINGSDGQKQSIAIAAIILVAILTLFFGLDWQFPELQSLNERTNTIVGGAKLSLELVTLILGLVVYTAAFIAEVVRAGINSVSKGQWEASRSLGLKGGLVMQLVIFPQALRVMIPPLTSEYLNLAKNSSLATAIGYPDIYAISFNISEQTGRSLEILLIVMASYLSVNLIISLVMNRFNKIVQLKER